MGLVSSIAFMRQMLQSCENRAVGESSHTATCTVLAYLTSQILYDKPVLDAQQFVRPGLVDVGFFRPRAHADRAGVEPGSGRIERRMEPAPPNRGSVT